MEISQVRRLNNPRRTVHRQLSRVEEEEQGRREHCVSHPREEM
jgi:hypothetical protein